MAQTYALLLIWSCVSVAFGQRGSFAGTRPIGFPELQNRTTTTADGLGNRFGERDGTTQRLPVEALGDRDLVERLSKLPLDKQPFWFINWQALEQHRKNPQTYPQRPSPFNEPIVPNTDSRAGTPNSGTFNTGTTNSGTSNSGFPNTAIPNSGTPNSGTFNSGTTNSGTFNSGTTNSGTFNSGFPNTAIPNSGTPNSGTPNSGTFNSNFGVPNPSSGIHNKNTVSNSNAAATSSNAATAASNFGLTNKNGDSDEISSQEHSKESFENLNDKNVYHPQNENNYDVKKSKFIRF